MKKMIDRVRVSKQGKKFAVLVDGIQYGALYGSEAVAEMMKERAKEDHYIK